MAKALSASRLSVLVRKVHSLDDSTKSPFFNCGGLERRYSAGVREGLLKKRERLVEIGSKEDAFE